MSLFVASLFDVVDSSDQHWPTWELLLVGAVALAASVSARRVGRARGQRRFARWQRMDSADVEAELRATNKKMRTGLRVWTVVMVVLALPVLALVAVSVVFVGKWPGSIACVVAIAVGARWWWAKRVRGNV
jgi:hypothetical protein